MAEKLIHIKNVIGSGENGKVLLSDLDLSQQDLAKFADILSNYLKSGAFAADLSSPDTFNYGPRNYNIIPYFDSFENYLDKEIQGKMNILNGGLTGSIKILGTNLRSQNGAVSVQVHTENITTSLEKYLHPDANNESEEAWMTTSESSVTGTSKYYLSGYFYFTERLQNNIELIIVNKTNAEPGHSGSIIITPEMSVNGINTFYRFWSDGFQLTESDLLTFKLKISDNTTFYIDALQLEKIDDTYWSTYGQPRSFIQSGAVITDGMSIRLGSITAAAIKSGTITTNEIDTEDFSHNLNISANTTIQGQRALGNLIDYATTSFEVGSLDPLNGLEITSTNNDTLRSKFPGFTVNELTDYVFDVTSDFAIDRVDINGVPIIEPYTAIFWYNSDHQFLTYSPIIKESRSQNLTTPPGAAYGRAKLIKSVGTEFPLSELIAPKTYARLVTETTYVSGGKYIFDGEGATFENAGLTIKNTWGGTSFYADAGGIKLYNKVGDAVLYADASTGNLTLLGHLDGVTGTFTGHLKGGELTIGNLELNSANVIRAYGSSDTYNTGLWAGAATFNSAPFSVNLAGQLKATGVDLAGKITATSGSIGGWQISGGKLISGSGTGRVELDGPNNILKLNSSAWFYTNYDNASYIMLNGGLSGNSFIQAPTIAAEGVSGGVGYSINIGSAGIMSTEAGVPQKVKVNGSRVITEADITSSSKYGISKIWLEGTILKIET